MIVAFINNDIDLFDVLKISSFSSEEVMFVFANEQMLFDTKQIFLDLEKLFGEKFKFSYNLLEDITLDEEHLTSFFH